MKLLADRGGVDYKNTARQFYAGAVAAGGTAVNVVSGSGWVFLISAWLNSTASATASINVEVDGVTYSRVINCKGVDRTEGNRAAGGTYSIPIRFESSMSVTVSDGPAYVAVIYGLDTGSTRLYGQADVPNPYILKPTLGTFNQNYQTTTYFDVLNISGSGYLLAMHGAPGDDDGVIVYVNLIIDGITVYSGLNLMNSNDNTSNELHITTPIRFNSSLLIQTRSSGPTAGATLNTRYTLD